MGPQQVAFVTNIAVLPSAVNESGNTLNIFTKLLVLFLLLFIVFILIVKDQRGEGYAEAR